MIFFNKVFELLVAVSACVSITISAGCKPSLDTPAKKIVSGKTNRVVAVSYPLQYLTQKVVGPTIEVEFPVPPDSNPQTWRPNRDAIQKFQTADLIIANGTGATYADWLATVTLPESKICNTASRGMSLRDFIQVDDVNLVHTHGPEGEHSHPMMVSMTWLDPAIAKKQAKYIASELTKVYPDLESSITKNLKSLNGDLDPLIARLEILSQRFQIDSDKSKQPVILSATPDMKYLTRAAGINDLHFNWHADDLGEVKLESTKVEINKRLEQTGPSRNLILLPSSMVSTQLTKLLHEAKLAPVEIDTIEHRPRGGDYLSALAANIKRLDAIDPKPILKK